MEDGHKGNTYDTAEPCDISSQEHACLDAIKKQSALIPVLLATIYLPRDLPWVVDESRYPR